MPEPFVIVGASLTGASAAVALREEGFDGRIVLIGEETRPPYERPPLSKEYLRGEAPFEKSLVREEDYWAGAGIETVFGERATEIDPTRRVVRLGRGDDVAYDKVLVATGGRNRTLRIPGAHLAGVHQLRSVADADAIRAEIAPGRRATLVGMGFIGAEVAASLRSQGVEVTAIEGFKVPLMRVLGEEVGTVIARMHADHGVQMIFEDAVEAFEGSERVERVVTREGRRIECDFVVAGIGIEPVTEVVAGAGVEVDNGILVDERCRTNVEGIYAAGDVANHFHPVFQRRLRVEHWQNARKHGAAAARSMLGLDAPYAEVHWFWSDQYDDNLQYAGFHTEHDEMVVRGSMEERSFAVFYLKDSRILACAAMNRGKDARASMRLIASRAAVEPASLRDEDVDLKTL